MGAVEGRAGAEIDVAVLVRVQNSIKTCLWWYVDRRRRQTCILICILRRVYRKVFLKNSVKLVVKTEAHCRVGLELHAFLVAVEVHACDYRILETLEGLTADD